MLIHTTTHVQCSTWNIAPKAGFAQPRQEFKPEYAIARPDSWPLHAVLPARAATSNAGANRDGARRKLAGLHAEAVCGYEIRGTHRSPQCNYACDSCA